MTQDARDPAERREGEGSHAISNGTLAERPIWSKITLVAFSSKEKDCSACGRKTRWVFTNPGMHHVRWRACWEHMTPPMMEAVKAVYKEAGGYTWVTVDG
jgi:hypothetical protein